MKLIVDSGSTKTDWCFAQSSDTYVLVLLNAPLQDPVKYKIMGYEVSLRRSEADMIEVISVEEAAEIEKNRPKISEPLEKGSDSLSDTQLRDAAMKKRRTINVALVGNPNIFRAQTMRKCMSMSWVVR
jgi:hypothetical protein